MNRPNRAPLVAAAGWDQLAPLITERIDAGVSQGEIAVALGISASTVGRAERGHSVVSAQFVRKYRAQLTRLLGLAGEAGAAD